MITSLYDAVILAGRNYADSSSYVRALKNTVIDLSVFRLLPVGERLDHEKDAMCDYDHWRPPREGTTEVTNFQLIARRQL